MNNMKGWISDAAIRARPAEVLKIKIGRLGAARKTADGKRTWRMPEKLDHFVIARRNRENGKEDENFEVATDVHAAIGSAAPTELRVFLVSDDPHECFFSQFQRYDGKKLAWRCDGERAEDLANGREGRCHRGSEGGCQCKGYGRLQVGLEAAPTLGSVAVFRTTSIETIGNIQYSLALFKEEFGFLRGLPCLLRVYPAQVQYEQGGQTRTSTAYKVALELRATPEEARDIKATIVESRLLGAEEDRKLLAARQEDLDALDAAEEAEIAGEFHPDPNMITSVKTTEKIDHIKQEAGLTHTRGQGSGEAAGEANGEGQPGEEGARLPPSEPEPEPEQDAVRDATGEQIARMRELLDVPAVPMERRVQVEERIAAGLTHGQAKEGIAWLEREYGAAEAEVAR